MNHSTTAERLIRARDSLEGLSVGDAVGESLSYQHERCRKLSDFSAFRPGTLRYTDDTEMALALFETLMRLGGVDEDVLSWAYCSRFQADPDRGYGKMARHILKEIGNGIPWRDASSKAFGGGSFGNGAAMRVAPLGAYFADDLGILPEMAARSARVTHFHPEGIAGAIAVATAAAAASNQKGNSPGDAAEEIWNAVMNTTPESNVRIRLGIVRQRSLADARDVAREVGNGAEISAQDTVPFCIWSACRNLGCYREALLTTIEVGGDCDTNCAIVGGVVAAYSGGLDIPTDWQAARESLPL